MDFLISEIERVTQQARSRQSQMLGLRHNDDPIPRTRAYDK